MKNKKAEQAEKRKKLKEERRNRKKEAVITRENEQERKELPLILIVCEGKNTEPSYFNQFEVTSATIHAVGDGYNTTSLVEQAYELQQQAISKTTPYDEIWCVFDKDDFNQFDEAINLAKNYGFHVAYSNQAFEYWLLLHFNDHQGGGLHRDDCCKMLKEHLKQLGYTDNPKDKKEISKELFDLLLAIDPQDIKKRSRQELAIQRAKNIQEYHNEQNNSPSQAESSTTVFRLVEHLNEYL